MSSIIPFAALLTLAVGASVLWTNPRRFTNQVFGLASLTCAGWLFCVFYALRVGEHGGDPVPWLRSASSLGALYPWIIWLFMASIFTTEGGAPKTLLRSWPWLAICLLLASICFTHWFIPTDSTPENSKRGPGYFAYSAISMVLYVFLVVKSFRQMRGEKGIRRIELQFLTLNSGLSCIFAIAISALGAYLNERSISRLTPISVVVFYTLTAWAVTVHRVFDARQVIATVTQRLIVMLTLCTAIVGTWRGLSLILPSPADAMTAIALCSLMVSWLDRKIRGWFGLSSEQKIATTRRTIIEIARREGHPDKLVVEFENLLRDWGQTNYARLMFDSGEIYAAGDLELAKTRPGHASLCKDSWSTPESLQRQRPEPGLVDLRQFLSEFSLGLIVTAPRGTPTPSMLVALGTKVNHRPFTYPEVVQLQEIAEFMDNILARSRLTMQARQSEQLATIGLLGASLAHEIRNPLVSIKTFAHLLPTRFDDPEFRRRFNLLIPSEVDRIDSLTQQLLDLSNPRRHQMELMSLHTAVRETVDLMLTRATEGRVSISSTLVATQDNILADQNAIRQVLINLFINAIQALEHQEGDRRVEIRTRNSTNGNVIIEVSDNGPGIPPEQRSKLFHPFASTKTKGMGLGLAVCSDILHEHRATIIVPDTGRPGATFRITFPAPAANSAASPTR